MFTRLPVALSCHRHILANHFGIWCALWIRAINIPPNMGWPYLHRFISTPGRRCVGERKTPSDRRFKSSESQLYSSIKRISINWKLIMVLPQFHSFLVRLLLGRRNLNWFKHFIMLVFFLRFYATCTSTCHDVTSSYVTRIMSWACKEALKRLNLIFCWTSSFP